MKITKNKKEQNSKEEKPLTLNKKQVKVSDVEKLIKVGATVHISV